MEVYLVGGAVRDELLGRPVKERDWVVVGGSVEGMLGLGYRQVGRDFPVFLHPDTGEEYALARTERKTGPGHTGFQVHADENVTLEADLARRDLTINAMARDGDGVLVDPYGGRADLDARVLRHVSAAFGEDPLRVFRVARFAAVLPGFEVAGETMALMRQMAAGGALAELSAERVWGELAKALDAPRPERFLAVLRGCAALDPWLVEFADRSPGSVGAGLTAAQRFAAFTSNLSAAAVESLCVRLKAPRRHLKIAAWVAKHAVGIAGWQREGVDALYQALGECRAFKPDGDLDAVLGVVASLGDVDLEPLKLAVRAAVDGVDVAALARQGRKGAALGKALDEARKKILRAAQG